MAVTPTWAETSGIKNQIFDPVVDELSGRSWVLNAEDVNSDAITAIMTFLMVS